MITLSLYQACSTCIALLGCWFTTPRTNYPNITCQDWIPWQRRLSVMCAVIKNPKRLSSSKCVWQQTNNEARLTQQGWWPLFWGWRGSGSSYPKYWQCPQSAAGCYDPSANSPAWAGAGLLDSPWGEEGDNPARWHWWPVKRGTISEDTALPMQMAIKLQNRRANGWTENHKTGIKIRRTNVAYIMSVSSVFKTEMIKMLSNSSL